MGATEIIASWVVKTSYDDIPAGAMNAAKETLFDSIGVMLAGSVEPLSEIIKDYTASLGGVPQARVLVSGFKTSLPNAALANGTIGMALDYDPEVLMMAIAAALLPAAEVEEASGKELLEAFVIGSELGWAVEQIALADMERRGLHHQGELASIAVAAACAKLLKLDDKGVITAMGIASSMGGGLLMSEGTMTKPLLGGLIARNGVMAAQLAQIGFTGPDDLFDNSSGFCSTPITEGVYDFGQMAKSLGKPYRINQFKYVRRYPCCRANHSPLDSILGLMKDEKLTYDDISSLEMDQPYNSLVMRYDAPENEHQGRFSIRYCVAAALADGRVGIDTFKPDRVSDPKIKDALKKVRINIQTQWEIGAGDTLGPIPVKLHLKDGRVLERSTAREDILGTQKNPLGLDGIAGKFRENASLALPPEKVEEAIRYWSPTADLEAVVPAIDTLIAS